MPNCMLCGAPIIAVTKPTGSPLVHCTAGKACGTVYHSSWNSTLGAMVINIIKAGTSGDRIQLGQAMIMELIDPYSL